jgi:hypothetical protein
MENRQRSHNVVALNGRYEASHIDAIVIFLQRRINLSLMQALPPCNTLRLSIALLSRALKISIQQLPREPAQ